MIPPRRRRLTPDDWAVLFTVGAFVIVVAFILAAYVD